MAESFFDKIYKNKTQHTPDVLSCLANLSNDEVFTPPDVVNQMLDLLPQDLFQNPNTTFLDPACKTGVFLREIAKRLLVGLEDKIPNLQERIDHIFHKQLYGIAITELTSLLSRRSLYCSKYPNGPYSITKFDNPEGNIRFRRINHTWGKNEKCVFCGASKEQWDRGENLETYAYEWIHTNNPEEIFKMKFDVIISNPPYQLDDGGAQASAMPIYNKFVEKTKMLNPRYITMIIPSRWFSGGKNLEGFRNSMLNDDQICEIHDFWNASECFPGVEIKGGVCYFLWKKEHHSDCKVVTHSNNEIISSMVRPLLEKDCNVFIRQNEAIELLHKVQKFNEKSFASVVHSAMTFGLRTFFDNFNDKKFDGAIKVFAKQKQGYINKKSIVRGTEYIDKWKVYIPEAIGSGDTRTDIIKPIIGPPYTICTETYVMNGPWKSEEEAKNVCSYISTKFFHFMIGLKKITQHTTTKVYEFVPMQDFSKPWTDKELYKKYELTQEEIDYIETSVWQNKGGDN